MLRKALPSRFSFSDTSCTRKTFCSLISLIKQKRSQSLFTQNLTSFHLCSLSVYVAFYSGQVALVFCLEYWMFVRKNGPGLFSEQCGNDKQIEGNLQRWESPGFSPWLVWETSGWNRNRLFLGLGFLHPKLKVVDLTMPTTASNLSMSDIQIPHILGF